MRLLRGRGADPAADLAITRDLLDRVPQGESALRLWRPHRVVAFGRRDTSRDGYERARQVARRHGYTPLERSVGGRAVAFTGATVAFVRAAPTDAPRAEVGRRYERTIEHVTAGLAELGVAVTRTEPANSFCPGTHSLSAGGKLAGLAQRVGSDVAVVSGVVVVRDHRALAAVLEPVYDALGLAFDPDSVGSVARAGGPDDPERVIEALADGLADDATVEWVRET